MKKILSIILIFLLLNAQCEEIVSEALLHLDKPYVYATEGLNTFDCSGFVLYCYQKVENIKLKRSAKDQGYDERFQKIENIEELLSGDCVYFNTNSRDSDLSDHVGIYIGNGHFVHCSSGKGKVIISSLLEGYYNKCFSWGRRIRRNKHGKCYDKTRLTR